MTNGKATSFGGVETKINQDCGTTGASIITKEINQAAGGEDDVFSVSKKHESVEPKNIPATQRSEDYQKLIQFGFDKRVAVKLEDIYKTGKLAHSDLDDRALDALKDFPVYMTLTVLKQFVDSNLEHVSNKSAYLCGLIKTYRQKFRSGQTSVPHQKSGQAKGPDEAKIKAILERTGYSLDVTGGQRKYERQPQNCDTMRPGNGCEVFCGKIPQDVYEDELIPLFEKCGTIWDLRLMTDLITGRSRGYAFVTFINREQAREAVRQLNNFEIRKGRKIGVTLSYNKVRLFVGNIPKNKDHNELFEEFSKHAPGLTEVKLYSLPDDQKKNRGFCFLEYESHKAASLAKRRLGFHGVAWGCNITVDWADPQDELDDENVSKVKSLYVRNLTKDVTETKLKELFEAYGKVERVKKITFYAFVHFEERDSALKAMQELNGKEVMMGGSPIEISLAKPQYDDNKKVEMIRARERRMMQIMAKRQNGMPIAGGRGICGALVGRGDFGWLLGDPSCGLTGNGVASGRWPNGTVDAWNGGVAWSSAFGTAGGSTVDLPLTHNTTGRTSFSSDSNGNGSKSKPKNKRQVKHKTSAGKKSVNSLTIWEILSNVLNTDN